MNLVEKFKELVGTDIFTVEFTKKGGEYRKMNAMLSVKKHVKGTKPEVTAKRGETLFFTNKIGCYEMRGTSDRVGAENYRTIDLNTLISLKVNGKTYNNKLETI